MTLFDAAGLVVSLPARELEGVAPAGALLAPEALAAAPLSAELRRALDLVAAEGRRRRSRLVLLARPEMFTDAVPLDWLRERLGGIGSHLSLSDGHAVGVLPGLRNHVFLYRLGLADNAAAFRRLARRAPGFLAGLASQVNTAFHFATGTDPRGTSPPTVLLRLREPPSEPAPEPAPALAFYLNPRSVEQSVAWSIAHATPFAPTFATRFARATYLPLTEAALADPAACEGVAAQVARGYFDASHCLLLRLPELATPASPSLAARLTALLTRLAGARTRLPRVPAANIVCLGADLDTATRLALGCPVDLLVPGSFDFWRHPAAFYAGFAGITVLLDHARQPERARLAALWAKALGRPPALRWPAPDAACRTGPE